MRAFFAATRLPPSHRRRFELEGEGALTEALQELRSRAETWTALVMKAREK